MGWLLPRIPGVSRLQISNAATKELSLSMTHEFGPEGSVKVIKVQSTRYLVYVRERLILVKRVRLTVCHFFRHIAKDWDVVRLGGTLPVVNAYD